MKIHILASGSDGNVTYIETNKHKILIDLGMNTKYIKEKLKEINRNPEDIDHVFISHTHSDHIGALKTFIKSYNPKICISKIMSMELKEIKDYNNISIYEDEIILDDIKIEAFPTSHDAKDSRGFIITNNETSLVYLTDTGYINTVNLYNKLKNKTYYLIESNHDIEKLMNGKYPIWLKNRVNSDYGHLSNEMVSYHLTKLIGDNTRKIVLMHLSKQNNTEELAMQTITETFKDNNISFNNIVCAKQDESVEV